tara:strand:- start:255470 stop:255778 length:309 start_codon:yes stop_codon:yes gene_type:complete
MNKLKERWGIDSNFQLIIIFVVFAITGSSAAKLAAPVCEFFGIYKETSPWYIYWIVRISLIFPLYQLLLVSFGWLFGQFNFFWSFEKKMLTRLGLSRFLNQD